MTTAPVADQHRLLSVQEFDTKADQAKHRRASHPALATLAELAARASALDEEILGMSTEVSDLRREVTKAEDDVQSVRSRAERDRARLDAGQGSPKDLQALVSEVELLTRRQSDLEDIELEAMERLEAAEAALAAARAEATAIGASRTAAEAERDAAWGEIDAELALLATGRSAAVAGLDAALVALYEKLRESHGGIGAAPLARGACQGCHMNLNPSDLAVMEAAPAEQVLRCEECGRILIRGS